MNKKALIIPIIILSFAVVLFLTISGRWNTWDSNEAMQKTDDATVRADVTPLSTRVTGTVRVVNVSDYAHVTKGQCLIELEDADYRASLDQANAGLAAAEADLVANRDMKRTQDEKIAAARTVIQQAEAAIEAAKAGVSSVQGDVERANLEIARQRSLLSAKATTRQQFEGATADANRYLGMLSGRKADESRAVAALAQAKAGLAAEISQRVSLDTRDASLKAQIEARRAAITVAQVNLGYTKICSPVDGTVGERHVRPGQLVAAGVQVIDVVSPNSWIQANFKETQLRNIRIGNIAEIRIDSLPGQVFHARVTEVAPASGSQFALIPPDNATGNFTKIIQRIPVKLTLDANQASREFLRPGLSAVVAVDTRTK